MATILGLFFILILIALVWKFACTVIGWLYAYCETIIGGALIGGFVFWLFSWGIVTGLIIGAVIGGIVTLKEVF